MIRSELIQTIADQNPHLFQRDVERIVNTIFEEITDAMARGNGWSFVDLVRIPSRKEMPVSVAIPGPAKP